MGDFFILKANSERSVSGMWNWFRETRFWKLPMDAQPEDNSVKWNTEPHCSRKGFYSLSQSIKNFTKHPQAFTEKEICVFLPTSQSNKRYATTSCKYIQKQAEDEEKKKEKKTLLAPRPDATIRLARLHSRGGV